MHRPHAARRWQWIDPPHALALACLRQGAGLLPWGLVMGPLYDGVTLRHTGTVEMGLYAQPNDDLPIHSSLCTVAEWIRAGHVQCRFTRDALDRYVRPFAGEQLFGCADGPGWRYVVRVDVIPDAQSLFARER